MKRRGSILSGLSLTLLALVLLPHRGVQAASVLQEDRALEGVLANLAPNGAILASPSASEPNYRYDWVRDSALTMRALAQIAYDSRTSKELRERLASRIDLWIDWELRRQEQNRLTGLGEPRFNLDGSVNEDPWGRPQNDGPAIRALTAIRIAHQWLKEGRFTAVKDRLYAPRLPANTLIKRDLEFVAHHWSESSFDLWEEERANHYYTLVSARVALAQGALLARRLDDPEAARFYEEQAKQIASFLENFLEPYSGTIRYALNRQPGLPHKKSSLDIAVILAAIQTYDPRGRKESGFEVPIAPTLATLRELDREFEYRYPINRVNQNRDGEFMGPALGRYPEDIYDGVGFSGGNPWFLATLAAAEFYCDLSRDRSSALHPKKRSEWQELARMRFNRVHYHLNADGSMSEQFNRDRGFEQGARDLTWSYVAYLTAYRACFR